jgi:HK97 family phage major capsid protein
MRSAYRVVTRSGLTLQRLVQSYAELGLVGVLVTSRVGGELLRPEAVAVYTL